MNKRTLIFTVIVQVVCWGIIVLLMFSGNSEAQAIGSFQVTPPPPTPFLGPIYYNEEEVWKIFDHNLPGNTTNNNTVTHYDGVEHVDEGGYGYNGHLGVDYSVIYEPVLAAASGTVVEAGWSDASNHRVGYGLHVVMTHTVNADYETWYGHLSALSVQTGDVIVINPTNPNNTSRILGISGNTGHVFSGEGDCGTIPDVGPNCGQHLHLEIRNDDLVLNPYGWIGTPGTDPWDINGGPTSYYLWANQPATESEQYEDSGPAGVPLESPFDEQAARFMIDSHSADFFPVGGCSWGEVKTDTSSFNENYYWMGSNQGSNCYGQWAIIPDAFSPPGLYDVYLHMPDAANAALSAAYTIQYDNQTDQAIVVQAAYPNEAHSAWAYAGRFDFAMSTLVAEFMNVMSDTAFDDETIRRVLADAVRLVPVAPAPPLAPAILASFEVDGMAGGVSFADEDIMVYDANTADWSTYFDGSDVSLAGVVDLDAFYMQADDTILMSFDRPISLPGITPQVDDTDIVLFTPSSLGSTTNGTYTLYQSGDQMGLNEADTNANVDVIAFTPNGDLLISTFGQVGSFQDEDLLLAGTGGLSLYFDGSDVGLTLGTEDVDGAWIDQATGEIYLSTTGVFGVSGSGGDGADIFVCDPGSTGSNTTCTFGSGPGVMLFWNGSAHGFGKENVDSFSGNVIYPVTCTIPPNCSFEQLNEDEFLHWVATDDPPFHEWMPSTDSYHGYYSAEIVTQPFPGGQPGLTSATLSSSSVAVTPGTQYRISFYSKSIGDPGIGNYFYGTWSTGGGFPTLPIAGSTLWQRNETVVCSPPGAMSVILQFILLVPGSAFSLFLDDVSIVSEGQCPMFGSTGK